MEGPSYADLPAARFCLEGSSARSLFDRGGPLTLGRPWKGWRHGKRLAFLAAGAPWGPVHANTTKVGQLWFWEMFTLMIERYFGGLKDPLAVEGRFRVGVRTIHLSARSKIVKSDPLILRKNPFFKKESIMFRPSLFLILPI